MVQTGVVLQTKTLDPQAASTWHLKKNNPLFFAVTSGVHARIKCPMMELSASHTGIQTAISNITFVLNHTINLSGV